MSDHKFNFDDAIKRLDKSNSFGSIEQLGDQIQHIWEIADGIEFDESYRDVDLVVVCGMGGSALGTHVIETVFKEELKVPVVIARDYTLPNYVNEKTLVIGSSYSGNTEETLAATQDGIERGAKVTAISSGGKLAEMMKKHNLPALIFEPKYNPSNQPRMALGYSVFGQIALFSKAGLLDVTEDDYQAVLKTVAEVQLVASRHVETDKNPAKMLAFSFSDRIPVLTSAEHLEGSTHVFANQLNENAKQFSEFRVVPEINHHLMEGLKFPDSNSKNLFFFMLHSDLYMKSNQLRMKLTQQVLEKNNIDFLEHKLSGPTKLAQAFEAMLLGAYTVSYLTMLNNLDPCPIPWVDWFKAELAKAS